MLAGAQEDEGACVPDVSLWIILLKFDIFSYPSSYTDTTNTDLQ